MNYVLKEALIAVGIMLALGGISLIALVILYVLTAGY
jgi:hypothetical protein